MSDYSLVFHEPPKPFGSKDMVSLVKTSGFDFEGYRFLRSDMIFGTIVDVYVHGSVYAFYHKYPYKTRFFP